MFPDSNFFPEVMLPFSAGSQLGQTKNQSSVFRLTQTENLYFTGWEELKLID